MVVGHICKLCGVWMPGAARNTSLKLLPDIASKVKPRAAELSLPVSTYVGILISNQIASPVRLEAEPDGNLGRVAVHCSFGIKIAPKLAQIAREASLSENAAAEALIARDQRSGVRTLLILPGKIKRSPL